MRTEAYRERQREAARERYWRNVEVSRATGRENWHLRQNRGLVGYEPDNEKRRSREILRSYVRQGRVVKPSTCANCGAEVPKHRLHGHHESYEDPFDVTWVCSKCHGLTMRKGAANMPFITTKTLDERIEATKKALAGARERSTKVKQKIGKLEKRLERLEAQAAKASAAA